MKSYLIINESTTSVGFAKPVIGAYTAQAPTCSAKTTGRVDGAGTCGRQRYRAAPESPSCAPLVANRSDIQCFTSYLMVYGEKKKALKKKPNLALQIAIVAQGGRPTFCKNISYIDAHCTHSKTSDIPFFHVHNKFSL